MRRSALAIVGTTLLTLLPAAAVDGQGIPEEVDQLKDRVQGLEEAIEELWARKPERGERGDPGVQGQKGDIGRPGPPGPTQISYRAFAQVEVSDGSNRTADLMPANKSFCALKKVGIWDNGDSNEISFCELYINRERTWVLKAVSTGSSHAGCVAHCISWP